MNTFPINTIINGECVTMMKNMPDSCVDLIIADPPYNLSKGGFWKWDNSVKLKGLGGNWNKLIVQIIHEINICILIIHFENSFFLKAQNLSLIHI